MSTWKVLEDEQNHEQIVTKVLVVTPKYGHQPLNHIDNQIRITGTVHGQNEQKASDRVDAYVRAVARLQRKCVTLHDEEEQAVTRDPGFLMNYKKNNVHAI